MASKKKVPVSKVKKTQAKKKEKQKPKWTITKKILLICIIAMFLPIMLMGYYLLFPEEEVPLGAVLEVEEVYFVVKDQNGDQFTLETFAFITNEGDDDCEVRIRAFAIDVQTNLAMDQASVSIGKVAAQKTEEASVDMDLPKDGKYRVELLIFKDEKVTVKGSGTVNLQEAGTGGKDYHSNVEDAYPPDSKKEGSAPTIFNVIGVSVVVALVTIYVKRRGRQ